MEQPPVLSSLMSLYEQLRDEFELDPESFQVPPPPAPRFRPTVRLMDGRGFRGKYFNGNMDGQPPYFYFTINPRLARLSLPMTLWQEIPAARVPALDREKGNFYPRSRLERECLESLFHPGLAES